MTTRDRDLDALAEALERAQADRPSWLARLVRRALAKVAPFLVVAVAVTILLALAHVDLGVALHVMVYGGSFLAVVGVPMFLVHAWRQNTGLTWTPQDSQADLATEPGQVGQPQAGHVGPDLARPSATLPPATVTVVGVTALPAPAAALPHAVGQAAPIHSDAEEDTR